MSSRSGRVRQRRSTKPVSAGLAMKVDSKEMETLRQNEVAYKSRIRSLEVEMETLKYRLDSLRKAKSTTIVRREVEHVRVSSPKLGRRHSALSSPITSTASLQETTPIRSVCHHGDLSAQLEDLRKQVGSLERELLSEQAKYHKHSEELDRRHRSEIDTLREKYQVEISELRDKVKKMRNDKEKETETAVCEKCTRLHGDYERMRGENLQLREKLEEVLRVNQKLRDSNSLLQGKCETLLEDLSVKEAKWTEKEEALTAEIRKQWGERYHQWIVKAEKKMEELQQVNVILQTMLKTKAHDPDL